MSKVRSTSIFVESNFEMSFKVQRTGILYITRLYKIVYVANLNILIEI
jgi:hypothetical protein